MTTTQNGPSFGDMMTAHLTCDHIAGVCHRPDVTT